MTNPLKRVLAAGMVATTIAGAAPFLGIGVAAAAPTLAGPATIINPMGADLLAGDANDAWSFKLPAGAACKDDGLNGGRWHTYMVPGSEDPATLTYSGSGGLTGKSTGSGGSGTFRNSLYTVAGAQVTAQAPSTGDAQVINIPLMNFEVWNAGQIPSGVYNLGIACVDLDEASAVDSFWNTRITVTYPGGDASGAQISWAVGAVPDAPTGVTATPGDGTLAVAFTHAASTPAPTGYTVTATPTGGGAPVTATGSASPVTVSGLTNGAEYSVTVRATNGAGDSPESAPITATPAPAARPAVQNLQLTQGSPGSGTATISWSAPVGVAPTGYDVTVAPAGPVIDVTGTTAEVTGMVENTSYTFTVTPLHPAPYVGTPAMVSATALPSAVVYQELVVTVPEGVLTISQDCGQGPAGCEVDLGTASLITTGPGAGQFYEASGDLLPITVTDTRDEDPGWTATGTMEDFSAGASSFPGDHLGWTPAATGSGGFTSPSGTYVQQVAAGPAVAPNTAGGLGSGATLASTPGAGGLGVFALGAALELLIPVGTIDGTYTGTLTITAS